MKDTTSKVPAEPSKCLICGNPAELGVSRCALRRGVKQQFFPSSRHRTIPMCGWCSVKYSEPCGADLAGDGPARYLPGERQAASIPEQISRREGTSAVMIEAEEALLTLERQGVTVMFDATSRQLLLMGKVTPAMRGFVRERQGDILIAICARMSRIDGN